MLQQIIKWRSCEVTLVLWSSCGEKGYKVKLSRGFLSKRTRLLILSVHFCPKPWFFITYLDGIGVKPVKKSTWMQKKAYPIQVCCTYSRLLHRLDASATTSTLIWEHSRCVNYGLERDNILYIIFIFCEVWYSQKIFVCCLTINALITLWFCRIMSFICIVMMSQACRYGHFPKNTRPVSRRESGSSLQSVVPRQTGKQWWRWNVPRGWPTPPPKSRKWNAGVNQLGKDLI